LKGRHRTARRRFVGRSGKRKDDTFLYHLLYRLAMKLFPDRLSKLIVLINTGASHLEQAEYKAAVEVLEPIKSEVSEQLGPKYRAACGYNLGSGYRRLGRHQDAIRMFNEICLAYPLSIYARRAEQSRSETFTEAGMEAFAHKENPAPPSPHDLP